MQETTMKYYYLLLIAVLTVGCSETTVLDVPKEVSAKKAISSNVQEAQEAQEAYARLQESRSSND